MIFKKKYIFGTAVSGSVDFVENASIFEILTSVSKAHTDFAGVVLPDGLVWMVLDWRLRIKRRPANGESCCVLTWVPAWNKAFNIRCYKIIDENGYKCGEAVSRWTLVNAKTRRIARITADIMDLYGIAGDEDYFEYSRKTGSILSKAGKNFSGTSAAEGGYEAIGAGKGKQTAAVKIAGFEEENAAKDLSDENIEPENIEMEKLNREKNFFREAAFIKNIAKDAVCIRSSDADILPQMIDENNHVHNTVYSYLAELALAAGTNTDSVDISYRKEIELDEKLILEYCLYEGKSLVLIKDKRNMELNAIVLYGA